MRYLLCLIVLLGANQLYAQETTMCDSVYRYVDEEPMFKGGSAAMMQWLIANLEYPDTGIEEETGKIYLKLVIDREGWLQQISIKNTSAWNELNLEKLKKSAPQFIPAKFAGKCVCTELLLPMCILLD